MSKAEKDAFGRSLDGEPQDQQPDDPLEQLCVLATAPDPAAGQGPEESRPQSSKDPSTLLDGSIEIGNGRCIIIIITTTTTYYLQPTAYFLPNYLPTLPTYH